MNRLGYIYLIKCTITDKSYYKIDKGLIYFRTTETYPISTKIRCRKNITDEILISIVSDLENTLDSYNDIARRYSVDRHTVSCSNNGTRYAKRLCEVTDINYFPIRD